MLHSAESQCASLILCHQGDLSLIETAKAKPPNSCTGNELQQTRPAIPEVVILIFFK